MKIHSFAIITMLLSVVAMSTGKKFRIICTGWVHEQPDDILHEDPEWASRTYLDFTGNKAPTEVGEGTESQRLKVSRGSFIIQNVYLTNNSNQKQTYLLFNQKKKCWLLRDIEPKDKHLALLAGDVHLYVKRPEISGDAHVEPEYDSSDHENLNEDHDDNVPDVKFSASDDLTARVQALLKEKYPDGAESGSHADGDLREEVNEGSTVSQ